MQSAPLLANVGYPNLQYAFTIHSASGLKKPTLCSTAKPYVRVSVDGNRGTLRSTTDRNHGSDPQWRYRFKIDLQQPYRPDAVVKFEIMHHSSTWFDRSMGKVKVPVSHFLAGDGGQAQKLSYGVRLSGGETRGQLIISHQQNIINPTPGDGDVQAYLPTLKVPNYAPRPSQPSASDVIGWFATCLGIDEHVQDIAADGINI